jgi:hypothetical protein
MMTTTGGMMISLIELAAMATAAKALNIDMRLCQEQEFDRITQSYRASIGNDHIFFTDSNPILNLSLREMGIIWGGSGRGIRWMPSMGGVKW